MWLLSWLLNALYVSIYALNPAAAEDTIYLAAFAMYALARGCGGLLNWNFAIAYRGIVGTSPLPPKYAPTCRFPPSVMDRIFQISLASIRDSGGANIGNKTNACKVLSKTKKEWNWLAERENRRWGMFSLEFRPGYRFSLESVRRRYRETLGETLEERCQECGVGGLVISLSNCGSLRQEAKEEWTTILNWLVRGHRAARQLQLLIKDGQASTGLMTCSIVASFPHLEKLFLAGSKLSKTALVYLDSTYSPSRLRRIDLRVVNIVCWPSSFPTVRILALDTVSFDVDDNFSLCRDFFSSFPNLEALGLNGIQRLAPASLAQLKVNSVTRLYVGPRCLFHDKDTTPIPLVHSLTRYFRCRVKFLVLAPKHSNLPILASLLDTPTGKPHPLYLSRLSTIQISIGRTARGGQVESEKEIVEMLKSQWLE